MVKKDDFQILSNEYLTLVNSPLNPLTLDYRGSKLQAYLKDQRFTFLQHSVLIGLLLGDGTLSTNLENGQSNLKIEQAATSKGIEYVNFLYKVFQPWVGTPPKIRYKNQKPHSIWFRTFRMKELEFYREQFYRIDVNGQRRKQIPKLIHKWINPISLVIWYMDDGGKHKYAYYLHTQGFTRSENQCLQEALMSVFGVSVTIQRQLKKFSSLIKEEQEEQSSKVLSLEVSNIQNITSKISEQTESSELEALENENKYFFLRIPASSRKAFASLVGPFILSGFSYKLYLEDFGVGETPPPHNVDKI